MMNKPLLALSGTQPWFWACLYAGKDIENRDWPTRVRGTVAFHASKGMTRAQYNEACEVIGNICDGITRPDVIVPAYDSLPRGAIIGLIDIVDCVQSHPSPWFFGEYGFVLRNPRALKEPIPCKGALGFWQVPESIEKQIKEQLCTIAK